MNCFLLDIPFLWEALSGERIWVILKVANVMRKVWWLPQEEKEKKEKKVDLKICLAGEGKGTDNYTLLLRFVEIFQ